MGSSALIAVSVMLSHGGSAGLDAGLDGGNSRHAASEAVHVVGLALLNGAVHASTSRALAAQPSAELELQRSTLIAATQLLGHASASARNALLNVHNLRKRKSQTRNVERTAISRLCMQSNTTQVLVVQPPLELDAHSVASDTF